MINYSTMAHGGKRIGAGRKVGSKATHTVQAEAAKAELIKVYMENIKPINEALIKKAIDGDIQAIKEIHDRVWGKSPQAITGPDGKDLVLQVSGESASRYNVKPNESPL